MNSKCSSVMIVQEWCRRSFFYSENNNHYPHSSFIQTTSSTVIWSQITCSLYPFLKKKMWEQNYLILERPRTPSEQTQQQSKLGLLRSLHPKYFSFFCTILFNISFLSRSSPGRSMGRNAMLARLGWQCGQSTLRNISLLISHQSSCCTAKLSMASDPNFVQTAKWTTSSKSAGITYPFIFSL